MHAPAPRDVELGSYRVSVGAGLLDRVGELVTERAPAHRYAIITDAEVGPRYADRVARSFGRATEPLLLTIPAGEAQKTRETWARLTDELLAARMGRDSAIVALGGGVVGDLAGFVAATFMRGVPYVQVPTTLLAMVDASIGGKTGVDTPAGKNLVGAFHQPAVVIVDPVPLETLPEPHLRSGMAEVIKHGVIADADYFGRVLDALPLALGRRGDDWLESMMAIVVRSIEIKASVVTRDEREGGLRKTLNFGHTLGHAIEVCDEYRILHGEAVAAGMVHESDLAERAGIAERGTVDRVREAVAAAGLPTRRPPEHDPARLLAATRGDKKARGGVAEYALPARIGVMACGERGWSCPVSDELVLEVLTDCGLRAGSSSGVPSS
jgi:3-dehydroquinate synthase